MLDRIAGILHDVVRSNDFCMSTIGFPYGGVIEVLHGLTVWKVIHIIMRGGELFLHGKSRYPGVRFRADKQTEVNGSCLGTRTTVSIAAWNQTV
jgi:hypothetical protein